MMQCAILCIFMHVFFKATLSPSSYSGVQECETTNASIFSLFKYYIPMTTVQRFVVSKIIIIYLMHYY